MRTQEHAPPLAVGGFPAGDGRATTAAWTVDGRGPRLPGRRAPGLPGRRNDVATRTPAGHMLRLRPLGRAGPRARGREGAAAVVREVPRWRAGRARRDPVVVAAAAEAPTGEKKEEAPAAVEEKKEEAAPAAAEETAAAAETAPPAADAPAAEPAADAAAEAAAPAEPAAKAEEETPKA